MYTYLAGVSSYRSIAAVAVTMVAIATTTATTVAPHHYMRNLSVRMLDALRAFHCRDKYSKYR